MFNVKNNNIYITRGNSGEVNLSIVDSSGVPYRLEDGDSLLLSVKKGCDYSDFLITKDTYSTVEKKNGNRTEFQYTFSFEPSDTLELDFGNYVYDIILYFANGDVNTIVDTSLFCICKAVGS